MQRKTPLDRVLSTDRRSRLADQAAAQQMMIDAKATEAKAIAAADKEVARVKNEMTYGETDAETHLVQVRILLQQIKHSIMQSNLTFGKITTDSGEQSTNRQYILSALSALETALNGQNIITSTKMLELEKDITGIYLTKMVLMQSDDDKQRFHGYQLQSVITGINDLVKHTRALSAIMRYEYDAFHKLDEIAALQQVIQVRKARIEVQLPLARAIKAVESYAFDKKARNSTNKEKAANILLSVLEKIKREACRSEQPDREKIAEAVRDLIEAKTAFNAAHAANKGLFSKDKRVNELNAVLDATVKDLSPFKTTLAEKSAASMVRDLKSN